jgi:hypothetical protein
MGSLSHDFPVVNMTNVNFSSAENFIFTKIVSHGLRACRFEPESPLYKTGMFITAALIFYISIPLCVLVYLTTLLEIRDLRGVYYLNSCEG